jgi:hypothetical protein
MRPPLHARWLAGAGLLAVALGGCRPAPTAPEAAAPPRAPWFEEVSASLGIRFTHFAPTAYAMPASLGSGSVLLDYDQDGRLDLLLLQNGGPGSGHRNALFHQEADGRFRDASPGSGLDVEGWFMGAVAGDVNNDGLPDVLATEHGAVRLFLNRGGGRFVEVAVTAGLTNPQWAGPASFVDYDRDGWLDVVVGNYLDYDPTMACRDAHGQPDFCGPKSFGDAPVRLWHNRTRDPGAVPRFQETTATAGLAGHPGAALGLVCADFTGDGWPDLFCSDDGRPNRLFVNRHDGTFREEALQRGLALNTMGGTAANMGTAFADLNGDGMPDLLVTHLSEEFHSVFLQGPRGFFSDQVAAAGLQQQAWRGTGFGIVAADFNCDGFPDAAWANGLVRRAVPGQTPVAAGVDPWWGRYAQRAQLFAGEAGGRFRDASDANPALCGAAVVGRSLAVGDLDGDGGPDLVLSGIGGPVQIHHNVAPHRGHWIALSLRDPSAGHRDMIGAQAVVRSGSRQWWTLLQPAQSYLSSHSPVLHVGLGAVDRVDAIDVLWPSGLQERFSPAGVDRLHRLEAGSGRRIEP